MRDFMRDSGGVPALVLSTGELGSQKCAILYIIYNILDMLGALQQCINGFYLIGDGDGGSSSPPPLGKCALQQTFPEPFVE